MPGLVAWADQVVVVDSGSTDGTVPLAKAAGAEEVEQPWLGSQREYALRLPLLQHDWVYFVDADEWVSPQFAAEIAMKLARCAGFTHRVCLVFMGTLDPSLRLVQGLLDRPTHRPAPRHLGRESGERASLVDGRIRRLDNDPADEDRKGLAAWLHKHVRYAELEDERRAGQARLPRRRGRAPLLLLLRVVRDDRGVAAG